jgi:ABC-type transport system involved in multi-copper enzyme maturation permease subunit
MMLGTIVLREMQEYIKSKRFLIGFGIALMLITVSTVINIGEFEQRSREYQDSQLNGGGITEITVFRPPQALSILVRGESDYLGYRFGINDGSIPVRASDPAPSGTRDAGYNSGFEAFDFAFTVKVILSLIVIFLSYGSVTEEKAGGTLRLALSNSLPRHTLILGKCVGGLCVVILALLAGWIVSLLIVVMHPSVGLDADTFQRAAGILFLSALYLGAFYFLGLFISVISSRPSISMMVLLQVWMFLIVLYPNAAMLSARQWVKLPGEREIAGKKKAIEGTYYNISDIRLNVTERVYRLDRDFDRSLRHQVAVGEMLAGMSPASLFDRSSVRLARTGTSEYDRFVDGIYRYWVENMKSGAVTGGNVGGDRNIPPFRYGAETLSQSISGITGNAVLLFLWGVVFLALSVFAFLRKDVR